MTRPYILGLTGGIGMGKSTTALMFAEHGVPVWDADAAVHRLYAPGGAAVAALAAAFPRTVADGAVDRSMLKQAIASDPGALRRIEAIVHPLVAADRASFLACQTAPVVLLDIPLLFESGIDRICDGTVTVSVAPDLQRARVLARGTMTSDDLDLILARQMPDAEKRARATWTVDTATMDSARRAVQSILDQIKVALPHA